MEKLKTAFNLKDENGNDINVDAFGMGFQELIEIALNNLEYLNGKDK